MITILIAAGVTGLVALGAGYWLGRNAKVNERVNRRLDYEMSRPNIPRDLLPKNAERERP